MSPERWELIGRLFDEARELGPEERTTYLKEACAGDEDLCREVESLFAAEAYVGNFIANPAFEDAAELISGSVSSRKTGVTPRERIGSRLGPYELDEFIGAGGMGEVFAAADTRLGRRVAIKLLSAALRADDDRLQRFIQEARTASLLNHPNILTIHDFGEHEGAPYIVAELLEGETLRDLIRHGPLAPSRVIEIGIQIARGLAAAHDRGIIHRDLKPENLFLTLDGRMKVLDFGLAKLLEPPLGLARSESAGRGEAVIRTEPGMVMGTVSYMAPEQLRGEVTDQRTDIFALGIILFEMAAGTRPFGGSSTADTISAILQTPPPTLATLATLAALAGGEGREGAGLERIVRRCLEKSPAQRFQSMSDLIFALEGLLQLDSRPAAMVQAAADRPRWTGFRLPAWGGWVLAAIFMATSLFLGVMLMRRPLGEPRVVPFTSFSGQKARPSFAPDGNQIAFFWEGPTGREPGIYVKLIDSDTPLRVHPLDGNGQRGAGLAGTGGLAWSPDGRSLAFNRRGTNGGIFTIPALGGPERKLTDLSGEFDWSPDGETLAIVDRQTPDATSQIILLTIASGATRILTTPPSGYHGDRSPAWSPDGRAVAFIRSPNYLVSDLFQVPVNGGTPTRLTFDNLELPGSLEWTVDGREILFTSTRGGLPGLWRVGATGGRLRRETGIGEYAFDPSVAQRGGRLAYLYRRIDRNIWRTPGPHWSRTAGNERENGPVKLIASTREEVNPQISPDGRRIAFVSDRSGSREIWVSHSDGDDAVQLTSFDGSNTGAPRWSPDSRQIAFDSRFEGRTDIFIINADGGRPWRLTNDAFEDVLPSWSRDGRSIYLASKRSGDWQVWKMAVEGGQPAQITRNGGYEAFESPDGQFLCYSRRDGTVDPGIWRIPVGGGEEKRILDRGIWGYWALTDGGICLIDSAHHGGPVIEFFNFATQEFSILTRLDRSRAPSGPLAISVSGDGRWIYYWQADQIDNDIMLVENFR